MLSQLNTLTAANTFVVFICALLFTAHICLFLNVSRFQKYPLSDLNYINAGIMSALMTTTAFYTINFSSNTIKFIVLTAIGSITATVITLTLQRFINRVFHREKASG